MITKYMTSAQIAEAQRRVAGWKQGGAIPKANVARLEGKYFPYIMEANPTGGPLWHGLDNYRDRESCHRALRQYPTGGSVIYRCRKKTNKPARTRERQEVHHLETFVGGRAWVLISRYRSRAACYEMLPRYQNTGKPFRCKKQ